MNVSMLKGQTGCKCFACGQRILVGSEIAIVPNSLGVLHIVHKYHTETVKE